MFMHMFAAAIALFQALQVWLKASTLPFFFSTSERNNTHDRGWQEIRQTFEKSNTHDRGWQESGDM
jgi:hypothetical protein